MSAQPQRIETLFRAYQQLTIARLNPPRRGR